jgi:hypothetical protein
MVGRDLNYLIKNGKYVSQNTKAKHLKMSSEETESAFLKYCIAHPKEVENKLKNGDFQEIMEWLWQNFAICDMHTANRVYNAYKLDFAEKEKETPKEKSEPEIDYLEKDLNLRVESVPKYVRPEPVAVVPRPTPQIELKEPFKPQKSSNEEEIEKIRDLKKELHEYARTDIAKTRACVKKIKDEIMGGKENV